MNASQGRGATRRTPEYGAWQNMRQRAKRQGVTVCDRWLNSFENFLADMGERPDGLILGRIEADRGFEPGNCHWTTAASRWAAAHAPDCTCGYCQHQGKRTHGGSGTPEHNSWKSMLSRCTNPNDHTYPRYGGRGITVCERWLDFRRFLEDMGERPSLDYSLERKDNNGGYWCGHCEECLRLGRPANCKWATSAEQQRNLRSNRLLTFNGKTQCLTAWAEEAGLTRVCLQGRLRKGLSVEEALTRPLRSGGYQKRRPK